MSVSDILPDEALNVAPAPAPSAVDDIIPAHVTDPQVVQAASKDPSLWDRYLGFQEGQLAGATGGIGSLAGGLDYLGSLALGRSPEQAEQERAGITSALTYAPRTEEGKKQAAAMGETSSYLGQKGGEIAGEKVAEAMGSPALGAAANVAMNIPQYLVGMKGGKEALGKAPDKVPISETPPMPEATKPLTATGTERPAYFEINDPKSTENLGIKPEKVEAQEKPSGGALPDAQQAGRLALAKRVGLKEIRSSAISGDAQAAADDFDSTKYTNDPMGERMRGVIKNERQALTDHASGIIDDLGAREGTDQSTLIAKGKTMAKPLDMLSDHIDAETNKAYETARAQKGNTPIALPRLEAALKDPTLTNQLLASGQESFLKGAQNQLDHFKATNPEGLTVGHAEQYRQFLNTLWQSNKAAVGKLKDALDEDVSSQVGSDVFGSARQLHQLGKTLLDNPKGVAQIVGKDPLTPANRVTAHEDIPDKIANMSGDQFKNLINTYKMMPEELQPQAQAAIKEIQGHMVNRLLDAGSKYETQWNKKGVNNELANNSENFNTAFADDPKTAAKIKDLKDAGEMLRFNSAYRGAHAQASNMERSGVGKVASGIGGAVGGTVGHMVAGPVGIIPGAAAGKMGVGRSLGALDKSRILKAVEERVTQVP